MSRAAADTQRNARRPARRDRAVRLRGQNREGDNAGHRRHERRCQCRRSYASCRPPSTDQYGRDYRAAAYPVNAPHASHDQREHHQNRPRQAKTTAISRVVPRMRQCQPAAERQQNGAYNQVKQTRPREQLDPDERPRYYSRQRSGDQDRGQAPARLSLTPVAVQSPRCATALDLGFVPVTGKTSISCSAPPPCPPPNR
jgi:hypothetical protein